MILYENKISERLSKFSERARNTNFKKNNAYKSYIYLCFMLYIHKMQMLNIKHQCICVLFLLTQTHVQSVQKLMLQTWKRSKGHHKGSELHRNPWSKMSF